MAQPAEAAPAETAAPAKSKKKLFILLGAAVVLLGGGAGAWFLLHDSHADSAPKVEAAQPPIFMPLEPFVVNLQGGEKFLQTDITLQLAEEAQVELIKLHMPRVRSRLLTLLSGMEAEHLVSKEDKIKLAQAILTQIQLPFDSHGKPQQVKDVLFTSFVIQ
jgi:flagellar FliL protein